MNNFCFKSPFFTTPQARPNCLVFLDNDTVVVAGEESEAQVLHLHLASSPPPLSSPHFFRISLFFLVSFLGFVYIDIFYFTLPY